MIARLHGSTAAQRRPVGQTELRHTVGSSVGATHRRPCTSHSVHSCALVRARVDVRRWDGSGWQSERTRRGRMAGRLAWDAQRGRPPVLPCVPTAVRRQQHGSTRATLCLHCLRGFSAVRCIRLGRVARRPHPALRDCRLRRLRRLSPFTVVPLTRLDAPDGR